MVNEAARCVEEKVVESPEDADYGMILGTGFAPFRGGPLRFAEHFGLNKIVDEMNRLAQSEEKFPPCEILKKHARDGTKFYETGKRQLADILSVGRAGVSPADYRFKRNQTPGKMPGVPTGRMPVPQ